MHEDTLERQQVRRELALYCAGERVPERIVEQTVDVPVPQIETAYQPGDQASFTSTKWSMSEW